MVVFDSTILLPVLWPDVPVPKDRDTQRPVERFRERVDHLIQQLEQNRTKIIIPTPVLSEILVRAGSTGPEILNRINSEAVFLPVAFDMRAAVEVAAMTKRAIDSGNKRGGIDGTWNKIKYDRQIVAISKVEGASAVYSDDPGVHTLGSNVGLTVIGSWQLALPPENPQRSLDLSPPEGQPGADDRTDP